MDEMRPDTVAPPSEEVTRGEVIVTPDEARPYKVVFRRGKAVVSEQPVSSVAEGEALIKKELANVRISSRNGNGDA